MKALYGFTPTLAPFAEKSVKEQVALLKQWGCDAIFGGYDDPALVEELHAQGMKIYAEFACFQGKQWWKTIPASRPTLADGTLLDPIDWYHGVNPSEPTVREQLLAKLGTLVEEHELDGVWLDFIRWPCRGRWSHRACCVPPLMQQRYSALPPIAISTMTPPRRGEKSQRLPVTTRINGTHGGLPRLPLGLPRQALSFMPSGRPSH